MKRATDSGTNPVIGLPAPPRAREHNDPREALDASGVAPRGDLLREVLSDQHRERGTGVLFGERGQRVHRVRYSRAEELRAVHDESRVPADEELEHAGALLA